MTVDKALNILQSALDRCRVDDIRTPGVYGALTFLESCSEVKWPFDDFRAAMESRRSTNQDKEARWQALNASLNGIRRSVEGIKSE
jgi:hypothetical protein